MQNLPIWCSAAEVCEALHISRSTLYAYVSRGLIRSLPQPESKAHCYAREDVLRLARRRHARRQPEAGSLQNLDWGLPVLSSDISQIQDGQLFYRQTPLEDWLRRPWRDLLKALWGLSELTFSSLALPAYPGDLSAWSLSERWQMQLPWWDIQHALKPLPHVAQQASIVKLLYPEKWAQSPPWEWTTPCHDSREDQLIHTLLILCADHELNSSTFTARCIRSTGASRYAAISGALGALSGPMHGGQALKTQLWMQGLLAQPALERAWRAFVQSGQSVPGLGHRLYPEGDPRWKAWQTLLETQWATHPQATQILWLQEACQDLGWPTLDWVCASAALLLPHYGHHALDWFALGRLPGWLAHIQEQDQSKHLIRPRARSEGFKRS